MYWDKVDPEWVEMGKKNPKQLGIGQRKQRKTGGQSTLTKNAR